MAIKISDPIRTTDAEFNKLITRISGEFRKQVEEVENRKWHERKRKNSPKKTRPPQRYILKFKNGEILGAQTFILSVGFGARLLLTEPHYYKKEKERYHEILPDDCLEAILFTSFLPAINEMVEILTKDTPVDFIDRGKEYKTTISFTETPEEKERLAKFCKQRVREEQPKFREKILKKYNGTCVVTGCNILAILDAAHILSVEYGGDYKPNNGLLLRADLHRLFDANLMAIDPATGKVHFKDKSKHYNKYDQKIVDISKASRENLKIHWRKFQTT